MKAVKCQRIDGEMRYSTQKLYLDDEEKLSRQVSDLQMEKKHTVFCIAGVTPERIIADRPSIKYWAGNHSINEFKGRNELRLINNATLKYTATKTAPKTLLNSITKALAKTGAYTSIDIFIFCVSDAHVEWLRSQSTSSSQFEGNETWDCDDADAQPRLRTRDVSHRVHPNACYTPMHRHAGVPDISSYKFVGDAIAYQSFHEKQKWGSFYILRSKPCGVGRYENAGVCPHCQSITGNTIRNDSLVSITYEGSQYSAVLEQNPMLSQQLINISPCQHVQQNGMPVCDLSVEKRDIRLIHDLATNVLHGRDQGDITAVSTLKGLVESMSTQFAVYMDVAQASARSMPHFHIYCLPSDAAPLPSWEPASWDIAQDQDADTKIKRMLGAPFYCVTLTGASLDALAATIVKLSARLKALHIPYNLLVYPKSVGTSPNGGTEGIPNIVIVPRVREFSMEVGQVLSGLEFLSGIVAPDFECIGVMDSVVRDRAFRSVTLSDEAALYFERELRAKFGLPPAGKAVYASRNKQNEIRPVVKKNEIFRTGTNSAKNSHWCSRSGAVTTEHAASNNRETEDILVRIVRFSISQADRLVLTQLGNDAAMTEYVLGNDAGGYIVDPGPHREFRVGQKVVVLSRKLCNNCEQCRMFSGNICSSMTHGGKDFHGSFAQLVPVSRDRVVPVGRNFATDALPLVQPLASVLHAIFRIKERLSSFQQQSGTEDALNHPVTVYGMGPMGCLVTLALQRFWPTLPVVCIEPNDIRRKYAHTLSIGKQIEAAMPDAHRSRISIVTSSSLDAYREACNCIFGSGVVLAFSELDLKDRNSSDEKRRMEASILNALHLGEETRLQENRPTFVGTNGFNHDDIHRAISELLSHYTTHYSKVYEVLVDGLDAEGGRIRGMIKDKVSPAGRIVEAYLSPDGGLDAVNGTLISKSLKVLVRV